MKFREDIKPDIIPTREIVKGDRVKIHVTNVMADVISVKPDGTLSLQAGIMKVTAQANEVTILPSAAANEIKKHIAKSEAKLREVMAKPEVDLRGMQTDEAIPVLEQFLDRARMAKLNIVTVIHGKGTGVLRQAVHQALRREQRRIKSFRLGRYGEGEDGVTIVYLD